MPQKKPKPARTHVIHARVDHALYELIAKRAAAEERSLTSVVERALRELFQGGSQ